MFSALAASGLPARRLELEITESVLLQNNEATLATLHQLRALGVRIAMDDFGTGYSSLSYLRSFPFDKIKIDRCFVSDLSESSEDALAILRAVASLGISLGIATTAEGVETEEQLARVREEGCTEMQGYFFSPPRPLAEVQRLFWIGPRRRPAPPERRGGCAARCWRSSYCLLYCCRSQFARGKRSDVNAATLRRRLAFAILSAAIISVSLDMQGPASAAPSRAAKLKLVAFKTSPFPYEGQLPGRDKPFLDTEKDGRRGHTARGGTVYWEDTTYSDRRAPPFIPKGFDPARPGLIVVYFHGNQAALERDVWRRQQVPRQVAQSGLNAVLVAPQFAVDALDSSAGQFWEPRAFRRYLEEAAKHLARLDGDPWGSARFDALGW